MFRNLRRFAVVAAASFALLAGAAVAAPGEAAAAPDRYQGPTLSTKQGSFGGNKNVQLTLTNPNVADTLLSESLCTSTLLNGSEALKAFVAFNSKNYGDIVKIMANSNTKLGPAVTNNLFSPGPNTRSTEVAVADGVYIYLGTCGGIKSLEPGNVGVSMLPVIVPSGIGSIAPALEFGSLAMESGMGSTEYLSILSLLAGGS